MVKKERKGNILGDPPSLECYSTREMQGQVHQEKSDVRVQAEILRVHYEGNRWFNELAQDNPIEPKLNLNLKSPPPLHVACVTVKVVCFEYRCIRL